MREHSPWQSKLKLKHMKNPSFGEPRSLCQINQVCKEENQRKNLTFNNFATLCQIFASLQITQEEYKMQDRELEVTNEFHNPLLNFHKPEGILQPFAKFLQAIRNLAGLAKLMNFATPCKIFASSVKSSYTLQIFLH